MYIDTFEDPADDGYYSVLAGSVFELWDWDPVGSDRIGTWFVDYDETGNVCRTFEWENASYSYGELHPDVYVKWLGYLYAGSMTSKYVYLNDENGDPYPATSWASAIYWNCMPGSSCDIDVSLVLSVDSSTTTGGRMQILDGAAHYLEAFGSDMTSNVTIEYPYDLGATVAETLSRTDIKISETGSDYFDVPPHELGHTLSLQQLGEDHVSVDYSMNGDSWGPYMQEYESAATWEGWANYVTAVSWWDPGNPDSQPYWRQPDELVTLGGYESPDPVGAFNECDDVGGIAYQITKAFWDLDDASNETAGTPCVPTGADDVYDAGTSFIVSGWATFCNGGSNRCDNESDSNGRNMWDYWYNNDDRFADESDAFVTLILHNYMSQQDIY